MRLFGKQHKSEVRAAAEFVVFISEEVDSQWPSVCSALRPFDSRFATLGKDKFASYEFTLAAIALHMQALPNLLPPAVATRIRSHVMECLTTDQVGDYPRGTIAEYDSAWNKSFEDAELPLDAMASVLYDKLELTSTVPIGNIVLKSPLLLTALGNTIFKVAGAWWKNYTDMYRIVI